MNRQICLCLVCALVLPLTAGCGSKEKGVKLTTDTRTQEVKDQAGMKFKVDNWVQRISNGPDGEPAKRKSACTAVAREASKPELTSDMKAQLVEALKKMIEAEPMSEADNEMKEEIILEGNKAITALQGGGSSGG